MSQTDTRFGAFRIAFLITLVLLVIQYVLGMISNLEVQLPGNLPGGNAWNWVWSHSLIIQLHIYIGTLLLVVALVSLILPEEGVRARQVGQAHEKQSRVGCITPWREDRPRLLNGVP